MNVGIVGFSRSGKTTIFNALTGSEASVGAFGSRDANVAVIKVPDERVDTLAAILKSKKKVYVEFQFIDIAPGASTGDDKALDDAALTVLKNVDALVHVVRAFQNEDVIHPAGSIDPVRDCTALDEELALNDLIIIENRLDRLHKENRKDHEYALLERCKQAIESEGPLRKFTLSTQEDKDLAGFGFLSRKPLMLVGNYGEDAIGGDDPAGLHTYASEHGLPCMALCGALEMEVAQLAEDERATFRAELGLGEESRTQFLRTAYAMFGLITFLTFNKTEVRAWPVPKGSKAIDAAGVVHSDMQRGFIRAEVVHYDHFVTAGSMAKAKEDGHLRVEGKEHIVHDGDIVLFRFNV
jgi:GTP-binding protein YchF